MAIYRVTVTGIYHNQNIQNVLNFTDETVAAPSEEDLTLDLKNNWIENLRFLQNIEFVWTNIIVQKMLPVRQVPIITALVNFTGTLAGPGAHCSIAAIFALRTENPSRRGRGRFFLGGVHQASIDHSLMQANALNQYIATANTLTARYGGSGGGLYKLRVGPRSYQNEADYKEVITIIPRNYFGLVHSRNINVGG